MLQGQVIQNCIEELRGISKTDLCVMDPDGRVVASTFENGEMFEVIAREFATSAADSQAIRGYHLFKVEKERELLYIVLAGGNEDAYMIGRILVSQLGQLTRAYQEKYDRSGFFQSLIMDNLLLVDIYNRARKLQIPDAVRRVVYLVELEKGEESDMEQLLRSMEGDREGSYVTAIEEKSLVLIRSLDGEEDYRSLEDLARTIVDMGNTEAMVKLRVSFGTIVGELKEVSRSYKEARMAMEVGKIFYAQCPVNGYNALGVGRLIYQLPLNLCEIFLQEVLGNTLLPEEVDEEILHTAQKFLEYDLNISETSRQLFIHRNTLVYRIEKLQKATGLDMRVFEDALVFRLAMMVMNYLEYMKAKDL